MRAAAAITITPEEIKAWLRQFCKGDRLDEDFYRRIIDVFINAICLYDNKVAIYFNIGGGKQVSYIEIIESAEKPGKSTCSDLAQVGSQHSREQNSARGVVFISLKFFYPFSAPASVPRFAGSQARKSRKAWKASGNRSGFRDFFRCVRVLCTVGLHDIAIKNWAHSPKCVKRAARGSVLTNPI